MSADTRELLVGMAVACILIVAWFVLVYLFEPFARPVLTPGVLR